MTEHNVGSFEDSRTRIRRVRVHREIFNSYAQMQRTAMIMTQKMDEVLDHPEHKDLILTGLAMGYKMPSVEMVNARNVIIKTYLDGLDPHQGVVERNNIVEFPATTALQFYLVAHHSAMMIEDVVNNIAQSDYMLWIRKKKQGGGAYLGPTSLQEVFNVWCSLVNNAAYERRHVPVERRLPQDWTRYVV